jgi:hypothetical protein
VEHLVVRPHCRVGVVEDVEPIREVAGDHPDEPIELLAEADQARGVRLADQRLHHPARVEHQPLCTAAGQLEGTPASGVELGLPVDRMEERRGVARPAIGR